MRVVSLVPSWTETLLEAGVTVVGRTRFCIHPESAKAIPVVGGTKSVDLEKLKSLRPDFVVLDREENTREMSEGIRSLGLKTLVTHVENAQGVAQELDRLAEGLQAPALSEMAGRWREAVSLEADRNLRVKEWLTPNPNLGGPIVYVIWKNPWMCVSENTFIGSMLKLCGVNEIWSTGEKKYPEFEFAMLPQNASVLLSSEPFPFGKFKDDFRSESRPVALVDGEIYSWFGVRSLRFLEETRSNRQRPS